MRHFTLNEFIEIVESKVKLMIQKKVFIKRKWLKDVSNLPVDLVFVGSN